VRDFYHKYTVDEHTLLTIRNLERLTGDVEPGRQRFANILAGPLIELAADFAAALAPSGTVVLAGLLDTQAGAVASAYEKLGLTLRSRGAGEWPVLVLTNQSSSPRKRDPAKKN